MLAHRVEVAGDEDVGVAAQPEPRQTFAHGGGAAGEVVRAQVQAAVELAQAEQPERAFARAAGGAGCGRVGGAARPGGRAGRREYGDPGALPVTQTRASTAPQGDFGRQPGRAWPQSVAAAADRLDHACSRQPGQRDAHAVLAQSEQGARRDGGSRTQGLTTGA